MADLTGIEVTDMPSANSVGSADYFMIVQSGVNKKAPKSLVLQGIATEDETGNKVDLEINSSTYVMVAKLYDKNNVLLSTSSPIDLPLETMVVGAEYDEETKEIVLTLKNGTTVRFSVADLVDGLVSEETFDEAVEALQNEISDLAAQIVTTETKEGTEFTINDTFDARMKVKIKGNTEQDSYNGKNLCPQNNLNITNVNVTIPVNLDIGTYTFSIQDYQTNGSGQSLVQALYEGETSYVYLLGLSSTNKVVTTTLSRKLTNIRVFADLNYASSQGKTTTITSLMIESGSTATEYEPYVGGIPSPNPDYPQDIRVVTGDNSVNIFGKNLYEGTMELGSISGGDGTNGTNTNMVRTPNYIDLLNIRKIAIPNSNNSQQTIGLRFYNKDKQYLGSFSYTSLTVINLDTINVGNRTQYYTSNADIYYLRFVVTTSNDTTIKYAVMNNDTTYIAFQGIQTLPLHLGTEYLAQIGDYREGIIGSTNNWKIRRYVGKVILNGSENNWNSYDTAEINRFYLYLSQRGIADEGISNYFIRGNYANRNNSYNNLKMFVGIFNDNFTIQFRMDGTTLADFKTWLSTHNTIVYYVLETPTEETITDQTLIQDLNAIADARSYVGQTNVSSTYESGNAPMIINATALTGGLLYKSNIVTSISALSTDEEVPSAKCVYGIVGDINTLLDNLNGEVI